MLLTTLAFAQGIANVMNNLNYQIVGIMVVMMCLGGLAVILTISGSIAAAIQNRAKAKTAVRDKTGRENKCRRIDIDQSFSKRWGAFYIQS